jgi:hypothetical protein
MNGKKKESREFSVIKSEHTFPATGSHCHNKTYSRLLCSPPHLMAVTFELDQIIEGIQFSFAASVICIHAVVIHSLIS